MDAATAFEHRRDALRAQLAGARDMDEAARAVTMALEQTAAELMQQEGDELARQRQQAVLALARRAPRLLACARAEGELVVSPTAAAPARGRWLRAAGALVLAALALAMLADGKALFAALQAAGCALLLLAPAQSPLPQAKARGVLGVDADAAVRAVGELCAAADVCVSDLTLLSRDAGALAAGEAEEATLDLLASLVEARATGDGDAALCALSQAEQRLREMGVEIVDYDAEHAVLFDLLPTLGEARTVRPALLRDGKTLRRGVAACKMERGAAV